MYDYFRVRTNPTPNDIAGEIEKFHLPAPEQPHKRKFEQPANYSRFDPQVSILVFTTGVSPLPLLII
jgi:hypothetical protein